MSIRPLILLFGLMTGAPMLAQSVSGDPAAKCAPDLLAQYRSTEDGLSISVVLSLTDLEAFERWLSVTELPVQVRARYAPAQVLALQCDVLTFRKFVLPNPMVLFADLEKTAAFNELKVPGQNLNLNKINRLQSVTSPHPGQGQTVSLKENLFDTTDIDLRGRMILPEKTAGTSLHASFMATLIGGTGTSDVGARGVADGCRFTHSDFAVLLPDADSVYGQYQVSVQNHSYGVGGTDLYGPDAMAYDRSVEIRPDLLHVFSAGNEGNSAGKSVDYQQITGYSNLTGSFKMAKNILTVGTLDSFANVVSYSSRGPRYDGRIGPDLMAFGQDGSSGAAALVSGTALVLNEQYALTHGGTAAPAALLRAVLLNSADDIGRPGPDFETGFGNLNAYQAYKTLDQGQFWAGKLSAHKVDTFWMELPPDLAQFKLTLAWDDPPALAGAVKSLVNDLDLRLIGPDGKTTLPWVLNAAPNVDSLRLNAVRGRDTLNNVEQLSVAHPAPGIYALLVEADDLQGEQPFYLAYQYAQHGNFEWTCPLETDWIFGGQTAVLYWETSLPAQPGRLEYRLEDQTEWTFIDSVADIHTSGWRWLAPDTLAQARVRMVLSGGLTFETKMLISKALNLKVGLNCPDSLLFYWQNAAPNARYQLYGLGVKYMEPLFEMPDTQVVLNKQQFPQQRFAVAPILAGKTGARSSAPDIAQQGAACYLNNFFAELNTDEQVARLYLDIGTMYGLDSVAFEKMTGSGYALLAAVYPANALHFEQADAAPTPGTNYYRVRLTLKNGLVLYSDVATVYYPGPTGWLAYPNPLGKDGLLTVLTNRPGETTLRLFDVAGRQLGSRNLEDLYSVADLGNLPKGLYFYEVRVGGEVFIGKIIR
ncbi:MAG: S8 family peptidase [Bacteroidota bacterium]